MKQDSGRISLHHGNGGAYMRELISGLFARAFGNEYLADQSDSAILPSAGSHLAFTTDSFVVDPLFFPGGNIGTLAVCGTLNDLAVCGARPAFLSAGFIIEEGLSLDILQKVTESMAAEARRAGVAIVTGDTKVVGAGKCDKLFINTAGIGYVEDRSLGLSKGREIRPGDRVLLSGPPGMHGLAVLLARGEMKFRSDLTSDCANLYPLVSRMLEVSKGVRFLRDATRGGVATVLHEIARFSGFGIRLNEGWVPSDPAVRSLCEILGFDALYIANEGKLLGVVGRDEAEIVLEAMRKDPAGRDAAIIGEITDQHPGMVVMETVAGGDRILDELRGDQLPRIC